MCARFRRLKKSQRRIRLHGMAYSFLQEMSQTMTHLPERNPIPNLTFSAGKSWNDWFSSVPSTPTTENYAANEVSRPKRLPRKKIYFFQNFENLCIFHFFRDLKMWIFMILVMFLTNYNRDSYRNDPSGRPKSLCRGFCSKIECWDGSISHATGHTDHRSTFGDRYEWLLPEKILRFFLQIFVRGHGASETSAFGSILLFSTLYTVQ